MRRGGGGYGLVCKYLAGGVQYVYVSGGEGIKNGGRRPQLRKREGGRGRWEEEVCGKLEGEGGKA
jgi:hypothetical protein